MDVQILGQGKDFRSSMVRNKGVTVLEVNMEHILGRAVEIPCPTCPTCPISLKTSKKFQFICPGTSNS